MSTSYRNGDDPPTHSRETIRRFALVVLTAVCFAARYLWIGDASFVNDEGLLIRTALECNTSHSWALSGLLGSKGIVYGPTPIWLYQGFLRLTVNPVSLLLIKITFDSLLLVFAVIGLAKVKVAKGFTPLIWLLPLTSPVFWMYARSLWDNTFNISIVSLSLLFYLKFIEKGEGVRFGVAVLLSALAISIHPMALPWAAALVVHATIVAWMSRSTARVVPLLWFFLYLPVALFYLKQPAKPALAEGALPFASLGVEGAFFGIRTLTGVGFEYFSGPWLNFDAGPLIFGMRLLAVLLGLPLIILSLVSLRHLVGTFRLKALQDSRGVVSLAIGFHVVLAFLANLNSHPHYFNAIWIFFLLAVGFYSAERPNARSSTIISAAIFGNFLTLIATMTIVHQNHGLRSIRYGTSVAEKWRIAQEINSTSNESLVEMPADVEPFPRAIFALAALERAGGVISPLGPPVASKLEWKDKENTMNAELVLIVPGE